MSNHYSNPTASAAIGSVDKEIRRLTKEAKRIRQLRKAGTLTWEEEQKARKQFRGIFRSIWEESF